LKTHLFCAVARDDTFRARFGVDRIISGLCMSELSGYSGLAAQTLAEIAEIDRRIASLIELRDGLKRVFARVSTSGPAGTVHVHPERSRSALVEQVIIEMLEVADGRPLKTRELFESARRVSAHLKYVTFRSYLHRLKRRGVITAEKANHGSWRLSTDVVGAGGERSAFAKS
jgi:predicted transcriptional regulator